MHPGVKTPEYVVELARDIRTIRFKNTDVMNKMDEVIKKIRYELKKSL